MRITQLYRPIVPLNISLCGQETQTIRANTVRVAVRQQFSRRVHVPRDEAGLIKFSQTVEAVGASAYLSAADSIKELDVLAALSMHASEAEHTAALADIVAPGTDLAATIGISWQRLGDWWRRDAGTLPAPHYSLAGVEQYSALPLRWTDRDNVAAD